MTQTEQRAHHYGFAMIPRTVIRGDAYKDLSLLERGLYVGLKDICGETGECYYCLRNLAKELHTSISTLSRYIPKLKAAGVIQAEKKVRSTHNKHEVWHIRIVDIWAANDALYSPQNCFTEKQKSVSENESPVATRKIVSDRNSSPAQIVSDGNEDCFYLNAKEYLDCIDTLRENEKEIRSDASATASDITSAPSFSSEEKAEPREETPPQQTEAHPIATAPVQPTQDMLLPEASHPLSEDEWLTLRGRFEQQVHARWKECQPKQGIRAAHATFAAFKKMEMRAWDLRTPKPQKNVTDALWAQLTSPEVEAVKRWFSLRRGAVITSLDVAGAQLFTESGLDFTAEQMLKERDWLRETQSNWFGFEGTKRGKVTLKDIAENAAAWLEADAQQTQQAPHAKIIEITTGHASNRYAQASLPGGKPSWMMTDEEIDALPTPLERKAARISKRNRLEFDRQQQEQSAPFAIAR